MNTKLQHGILNAHKYFIFKHSYQFITHDKQCYNVYIKILNILKF